MRLHLYSGWPYMDLVYGVAETANLMSALTNRARAIVAKCGAAGWSLTYGGCTLLRMTGTVNGQVRGFRLQLWREHLGGLDDLFNQPESPACTARVRRLAEENWRAYTGDEVT